MGPGARDVSGNLVPVCVKEGDTVLLPEYGGTSVKLGEKEYASTFLALFVETMVFDSNFPALFIPTVFASLVHCYDPKLNDFIILKRDWKIQDYVRI